MRNYAFSNATSSRSLSVNAYHTMPRWHWSREHRRYLLPEARLDADMFLLCINRDMATSIRCFLDGSLVVSSIHWWFDAGLSTATKASLSAALYLTVNGQSSWLGKQIRSWAMMAIFHRRSCWSMHKSNRHDCLAHVHNCLAFPTSVSYSLDHEIMPLPGTERELWGHQTSHYERVIIKVSLR
jgi:hypothetical protein